VNSGVNRCTQLIDLRTGGSRSTHPSSLLRQSDVSPVGLDARNRPVLGAYLRHYTPRGRTAA
jgi:hypothetical protein